jgi:cyclopropane-fatty-acyl-phospholipid synthase
MRKRTVADAITPPLASVLGSPLPLRIRFWDGSQIGPEEAPACVTLRSPRALRHMIWAPGELGLARAYVAGDIDLMEGTPWDLLAVRDTLVHPHEHYRPGFGLRATLDLARALGRDLIGPPPRPPEVEARPRGRLHSPVRDRQAITHHYDVSNAFYRLLLGPTMTYSCAYWAEPGAGLDVAQEAKYELICRKLNLQPGQRLLDVGCGWGGMVMHAARHHGVRAVGVTISTEQHDLAKLRVRDAGLEDRVEIRLQDYRELGDEAFDAISSVGMFEHVGARRMATYMEQLAGHLHLGGRLLNHAISRPSGPSGIARNSFIARYVFPDGELLEVGRVVSAMQNAGLEVRDVESLREHYALTLRAWSDNLEQSWPAAVAAVGEARARVWRLYIPACAVAFEDARISIHQVLAVKTQDRVPTRMPLDRRVLLGNGPLATQADVVLAAAGSAPTL